MEGDIGLTTLSSDSPPSWEDEEIDATLGGFGDLTMTEPEYENGEYLSEDLGEEKETGPNLGGGLVNSGGDGVAVDDLLASLSKRHGDALTTQQSRYRFAAITKLDVSEGFVEPDIVGITNTCPPWPCHVVVDSWYKLKVSLARRCKLPCCRELTWPQEWARHRRFCISKKHYLVLNLTSKESDAVLRWSDLVQSTEWREGNWSDKGILRMSDATKFKTQKVSWSIMEDHLAILAYSDKKEIVLLAARICMEALAKNRALYSHGHQFWGFARICTDLLKSPHAEIHEGLILSLQLYLRTLKIFLTCYSTKCSEYASSGLFPVLLNLLKVSQPKVQAAIVNIINLMIMHAPYVSLLINLGALDAIVKLATSDNERLRTRVHACLEIISRYTAAPNTLVSSGVLALMVRHLPHPPPQVQLSCLFILNNLCVTGDNLKEILAVDDDAILKATMKIVTDWTVQNPRGQESSPSSSVSQQSQPWCTIPRQNLILLCKLCVNEMASKKMAKRGLVLTLQAIWYLTDCDQERRLVLDTVANMASFPLPADKICNEGFLTIFAEHIVEKVYHGPIMDIISKLGKKYLPQMLASGLVEELITCFRNKLLSRRLNTQALSILATFSSNDKVKALILSREGQAYAQILDTAFLTCEGPVLQSCVAILGKMNTSVVPFQILKQNTLHIVAYIDKLLKTGPDGMVLHGLMQLQDCLRVSFLQKAFCEHHVQKVLDILSTAPYKPPVQFLALQALESLTGVRSRKSSLSFDTSRKRSTSTDTDGDGERQDKGEGSFSRMSLDMVRDRLASEPVTWVKLESKDCADETSETVKLEDPGTGSDSARGNEAFVPAVNSSVRDDDTFVFCDDYDKGYDKNDDGDSDGDGDFELV